MTRISIEVTTDIHKAIKLAAIDNGLSLKDFVIRKLMENHTHKKPKSSAGHDDCPLCRAFGKNREYNAKTLKALDNAKNKSGMLKFTNAKDAIDYLRS